MKPIRNLSLILILGAAPALAQDGAVGKDAPRQAPKPATATGLTLKEVRDTFARVDADRSGSLSADEAAAGSLDATAFTGADADGDKKLSPDEFTVGSEARASKLATGAGADLTAESTRLQALRRAQKAEELKSRRESVPPAAARTAGQKPEPPVPAATVPETTPAPAGPAAARRALAPDAAGAKEPTLQEIRSSIVRRLRNGEISQEEARVRLEAIDLRIANATAGTPTPATPSPAPASEPSGAASDVRGLEEALNRRLRGSELDPAKPKDSPEAPARRAEGPSGSADASAAGATPEAAKPESIRARIAEAQTDLTRRLRNAEVTPEQAAIEQAALAKRLRNAVESLPQVPNPQGETAAPASPTPAKTDSAPPPAARARGESAAPVAPTPAPARTESATPSRPKEKATPPPPVVASPPVTPPVTEKPAPARPPAPEKDREEAKPARPASPARPDGKPAGG